MVRVAEAGVAGPVGGDSRGDGVGSGGVSATLDIGMSMFEIVPNVAVRHVTDIGGRRCALITSIPKGVGGRAPRVRVAREEGKQAFISFKVVFCQQIAGPDDSNHSIALVYKMSRT